MKTLISYLSFYIFSYSHKVDATTNIEVVLLDLKSTYFLVNTIYFKILSLTVSLRRVWENNFFSLIDECYFQDELFEKIKN